MKLLIIEDDEVVSETIRARLRASYIIDYALNAENGCYLAEFNEYDLLIIDYYLPDSDGLSLAKKLRLSGIATPILMLTGKGDIETKVNSLDAGVDDYLTKPFHFSELQARIRALLRRNHEVHNFPNLVYGDIVLNNTTNAVTKAGVPIILRRKEYALLEFFMRHAEQVITRTMIVDHVWENDTDPITNTIEVHIRMLRKKIDKPFGTNLIKTLHGIGYKLSH